VRRGLPISAAGRVGQPGKFQGKGQEGMQTRIRLRLSEDRGRDFLFEGPPLKSPFFGGVKRLKTLRKISHGPILKFSLQIMGTGVNLDSLSDAGSAAKAYLILGEHKAMEKKQYVGAIFCGKTIKSYAREIRRRKGGGGHRLRVPAQM